MVLGGQRSEIKHFSNLDNQVVKLIKENTEEIWEKEVWYYLWYSLWYYEHEILDKAKQNYLIQAKSLESRHMRGTDYWFYLGGISYIIKSMHHV